MDQHTVFNFLHRMADELVQVNYWKETFEDSQG